MGGMGGTGGGEKEKIEGVSIDVPFIQCAACKALVKRAFFVTKQKRAALTKVKLTEEMILSNISSLCLDETLDGEWIHSYDMVEDGRTITLKRMGYAGVCAVECKTVALACQSALDDIESDLATSLYSQHDPKEAQTALCASQCSKPPPPTPESRLNGPLFEEKPKEPTAEQLAAMKPKRKKGKKKKAKAKEEL
uniref:Uncharacterized protein n=1 Tax=Haptolina brevifila TaxID=156173 RepID=A0A7S2D2E4_9EUKA